MRGEGDYDPETGFGEDYRRFYDLDLGQRFFTVAHGEHRLAVQIFKPTSTPRGSAVVVHGYYDHVGLYGHLIRYLLGKDLVVLAYDQQGHGLSTGEAATIETFDEYVDALADVLDKTRRQLPGPHHAVAQSMGAAVLMEYLMRGDAQAFEQTVFLAPLVRPKGWPVNKLVYLLAKPFVKGVARGVGKNSEDPEFIALLKADPLQARVLSVRWVTAMVNWMERFETYGPIDIKPLVVQGGRDDTVDAEFNLSVLRGIFELELMEIPEARHHLVNETDQIRAQIWRFLDRYF